MTKQEAIKKAYGEYWDILKHRIDENGRINYYLLQSKAYNAFKDLDMGFTPMGQLCRPKCLTGIEDNNGWIDIQNFDYNDPEGKRNRYFLLIDGEVIIGYWCPIGRFFYQMEGHITVSHPTHYQPIHKPKPPIY